MFAINIHKKFPPSKLGKQSQKLIIEPLKPQTRPKEMHDPNPRFPRPSEEPGGGAIRKYQGRSLRGGGLTFLTRSLVVYYLRKTPNVYF